MEKVCIEKLDNYGRGIAYINNKITFIPNALPEEMVEVEIQKVHKKYQEAIVTKYIKTSSKRVDAICPYYKECSGCMLMHMSYEDTLAFKKQKVQDIVKKYANEDRDISIVPSPSAIGYRNKITLKIRDGIVGYYKEGTHNVVEIPTCFVASTAIQMLMKNLQLLAIQNGEVIIRSNLKEELLLIIKTKEEVILPNAFLEPPLNLVGVVANDKTIYGQNFFYEQIGNQSFKITYDAFFQINREVCLLLFREIEKLVSKEECLLDLYCGVGTLGISIGNKVKQLYGIEVIPNAIEDAKENASLNNIENATYFCGKVEDILPNIEDKITTIILDPPREGLDKKTKEQLKKIMAEKIIYVSCDPMTLARDTKDLKELYDVVQITAFDMFPYTYHIESLVTLKRKA